ncbi:MAG TPA: hypothetical protein DEG17_24600 [Cyanobacteria bacterium UBA11149]|nr:hypothetical protein [Cyanobacteria bacterium UBA11366]HBK63892.1 hypothetical protein [Cyanobacteria bacterium UBA11166]HBR72985.1 hypothetical protein [Cyanobacteria bacterium UBA11159]HBS69442.1 hypothetical protein [Cyanobacteria bacterium UBA11153]HBW91959.1 hypothetical protein [Cyanobacteria bacterium UBA11149]HCA96022.1 hypothetical protein [Cyanobacteria bacterium UBA9226]
MLVLWVILVWLLVGGEAKAGLLSDRIANFPNWYDKPPVTAAKGDLVYPDWMEGNWQVSSTLIEQFAPLAPEIVTPGFSDNEGYINQNMTFQVRFQAVTESFLNRSNRFLTFPMTIFKTDRSQNKVIVADRAFNGLNIGKAYLGDRAIRSIKVDPNSPNRQVTVLSTGHQLVSIVTDRATETPAPDRFIGTEMTNQFFQGTSPPYFNQVETTTSYQLISSPRLMVEASQITAIYLSPQDPDYFKALDKPVAMYRYKLELVPLE